MKFRNKLIITSILSLLSITSLSASNVLIVYFSRSGNTEQIAEFIAKESGGTLFEIEPIVPYPSNYNETVLRFRAERDEEILPSIVDTDLDIDNYDVVFIGYPNWGNDIPPVIRTFIAAYELAGKRIIPFCTHGGGGFGRSRITLENLIGTTIERGFEISGRRSSSAEERVKEWINSLNLNG